MMAPSAGRYEARRKRVGELGQRCHIQYDQSSDIIYFAFKKRFFSGGAVVDDKANTVVLAQLPFDALKIALIGLIRLRDVDAHACLATQAIGDLLHSGQIARYQRKVVGTTGEPLA